MEPGTELGHYTVLSEIGRGGMGVVWKAKDNTLGREVAIKTLPPEFAQNADRLARFEREAKLLASLNHPNIAAIYGLEEHAGTRFLVLELVEGDTLADRLRHGAIPVEESLKLAIQIAEALEVAHEKGVIHRDLKPANVKVTPEGRVKVLDFGLAKALGGDTAGQSLSNSPTLSIAATQQGVILGTPAYMSPEQAKGQDVDRRADVWAFGCVLFEMLSGHPAFGADDTTEVLVQIMRDTPDWNALEVGPHPTLRALVERCLRKDQSRRYQHIGDVRVDLEEAGEVPPTAPASELGVTEVARRKAWTGGVALGIGMTMIAVAVVIGLGWLPSVGSVETLDLAVTQITSHPSELAVWGGAVSPDGTFAVYSDPTGLYLEIIATGESNAIDVSDELSFSELSWFPDGTRIIATGWSSITETVSIYSIPISIGGAPRRLVDGWRGAVSPDGTEIAYLDSAWPVQTIWVMGANGENPRPVVTAASGEAFWQTTWSPDGERLAFGTLAPGFSNSIQSVAVDREGERTTLVSDPRIFMDWRGTLPFVWLPDGRLLYTLEEPRPNLNSSNLWAIETSVAEGLPEGEPIRMTNLLGSNLRDIRMNQNGSGVSMLRERQIADVYIGELADGGRSFAGPPRRLTFDDRLDDPSDWTPDSRTVLFSSDRGNNGRDIYAQTLDEPVADLIVNDPLTLWFPTMSPDGSWILYVSDGADRGWGDFRGIARVPAGGGPSEPVFETSQLAFFDCGLERCVVSQQEGAELVFYELDPLTGPGTEITRTSLEFETDAFANWGLSPDGSRIALTNFASIIRIIDIEADTEADFMIEGWTGLESVDWAAGDDAVYVVGHAENGPRLNNFGLLHVDMDGVATVLSHEVNQWINRAAPSPDGRYLAFARAQLESNLWLIEGF